MPYLEINPDYEGGSLDTLRSEIRRFAVEEMRPVGQEIDRMTPTELEEVVDRPSPLWDVVEQMRELGYHQVGFPEDLGGTEFTPQETHVMLEELAWGDYPLTSVLRAGGAAAMYAALSENERLIETITKPYLEDPSSGIYGCWGVTEPQHGSDHIGHGTDSLQEEESDVPPPQATAEKDGDEYVIQGVKSSWVGGAPMATHMVAHVNQQPADGEPGGSICIIPLDLPGVQKPKPIEKLGMRALPQGEVHFDNVRIPEENMVVSADELRPDSGAMPYHQVFARTGAAMATSLSDLVRASFEEALKYAQERKQGGKPIAEHQLIKEKLYDMFEMTEISRAYSRRIWEHVMEGQYGVTHGYGDEASYRHALSASLYCKQAAYQTAHDAMTVFGANGMTKDYPVEKFFRDARVLLYGDGTPQVLKMEAANDILENYDVGV